MSNDNNQQSQLEHFAISGKELTGLEYEPLFPYFAKQNNAFQVLEGDFVTTEDGTGIVHMAPGFGEDDHILCKKHNIEVVCPIDDGGNFILEMHDINYSLAGKDEIFSIKNKHVFECNDEVIKYLKGNNLWLKTEQYLHNYPHCWRTDTPLIYRTITSWYVKVTAIKERMVELNQRINWVPHHIKDGMFGTWLANARDWSISRNRFWGCPIPVWKSTNPQYPRIDVYGSIAELEQDFSDHYKRANGHDLKIESLHRPFIDILTRPNPNDPTGESMMVRVEDVLDCWFESGSMPFASTHYPFACRQNGVEIRSKEENKAWFENHFPADFIVEYAAQTRGWFYTLMVLGVALFDSPPFLNCICHGVILDENSQKLSKRLRNYPDPMEMFNTYGSDAMRFLMMRSPAMQGNEINIDRNGKIIADVSRLTIASIWNSRSFLQTYMEASSLNTITNKYEALFSLESTNQMDKYIISKLKTTVSKIKEGLDQYNTIISCNAIDNFIEILNNWYIRRSKKRFKWTAIFTKQKNPSITIDAAEFSGKIGDDLRKTPLNDHINILLNSIADLKPEQATELIVKIKRITTEENNLEWTELAKTISVAINSTNPKSIDKSLITLGRNLALDVIDAQINLPQQNWRITSQKNNPQDYTIIGKTQKEAISTLYSVLIIFCQAAAPLLPCTTEKIYLDLM